mmetsp:Transcript_7751/g.31508  ORF Transcript_7751/g.31508 Transcript_7751/m.31508 type:complete len:280 (-) Transcript_7751:1038-1877(-)
MAARRSGGHDDARAGVARGNTQRSNAGNFFSSASAVRSTDAARVVTQHKNARPTSQRACKARRSRMLALAACFDALASPPESLRGDQRRSLGLHPDIHGRVLPVVPPVALRRARLVTRGCEQLAVHVDVPAEPRRGSASLEHHTTALDVVHSGLAHVRAALELQEEPEQPPSRHRRAHVQQVDTPIRQPRARCWLHVFRVPLRVFHPHEQQRALYHAPRAIRVAAAEARLHVAELRARRGVCRTGSLRARGPATRHGALPLADFLALLWQKVHPPGVRP